MSTNDRLTGAWPASPRETGAGRARNQQDASTRRSGIVALARDRGSLAVADLPERFGVSPETIRRDLRRLEEAGQIVRAYGSIRAVDSGSFETGQQERAEHSTQEKLRIAAEAVARIGRAKTIVVDEGYLPLLIGRALPTDHPLTVVTTALPTAMELVAAPNLTVYVVGGRLRGGTFGVVDHWAERMLGAMEPDLAFVGANGITEEGWLTTPDPAVAAIKETIINVSRRRIFVGDHEKFGRSTFTRFGRVSDMECLITGRELRESTARRFAVFGPEIVRV
ncbi:DeoR/GlpR family DNA-binding transcription regulator [Actinomyces viscosus]|uniref:DeoR/GlpR family DNA-binding transcription regulator n=1 Tax=Actinomyces viscosus TaxID=1656 RepID=UPI0028EFEB74|nr:DeoR/GlpR family DNA-binding transcription regulator [Actinomyces viscosus]